MRNLKRFLAVLVVVALMATSMIPAFAAEPELTPIEVVTGLGIVEGAGNGVDDEYLAADTTKIQAAVILLKALGLYEEATDFDGEENFEDADEVTWADGRRILAYLKANPDLGWVGNPDGTFDAYAVIEPAQLYKVMLELLGYEQNVDFKWSEVLDKAVEFGMAGEYVDGEGVTNEDMIGIIYEGLYTPVKDGEEDDLLLVYLAEINEAIKEKAIDLGLIVEEPDEITATVAATGAKKLTVTFNQPVDSTKAVFTVKRGSVKPSVKSITFSEDKTSAVIEFNVNLTAGDYTVEITGLTEEAITLTTKVEAAKLTTIEFKSDVAVISDVYANKSVKVGVVAKNQYGEEISGFAPNVSASKGSGSVASGILTLTVTSGSYTVGEKIVVTLVDPTTSVVATQTLTVAQAAQVDSITVGELKTDDKDLAAKPINVSNLNSNLSKYYIPVEIKDQYGNKLKAAELVGVDILSSNKEIINPKGFKNLDNGTTVIELQAATSSPAKGGTVVITVVAAGTGKTASTTVTVLENAKIDTVVLSAPETELKLNKAAVLPITVIDTYGNEVALKDITFTAEKTGESLASATELKLNTDTKLTASGATLAVKKNYITDVTTIEITPTNKNIVLTVTTATTKFQSLPLVAVDAPVPTSIKGMKSDFVSMLADVDTMKTDFYSKVELLDQYGDTFSDAMPSGYTYTVTAKDTPAYTNYVSGAVYAKGEDKVGTDVYVVKLTKTSGSNTETLDELEVAVTVVDKEKITAFGIDDLNKFYTGATSSNYAQTVKIHGLVDGKKVAVPQTMIKMVTASNGLPVSTTGVFDVSTAVYTDNKDVSSIITVWVEAGSNTYTLTKDVVYSSAAPKAASLVIKKGDDEVTNAVEVALTSGNLFTGIDGLKVVAKDQYSVDKNTDAKFAITNNETGLTMVINDNGDLTITGGTIVPGKSFTLTVYMDGLYKSAKVFVK